MADNTLSSNGTDSVDEALHRLSRKPGVKGWLMLDRSNGAILKTSGQISSIRPAKSSNTETTLPTPTGGSFSGDVSNPADADNDTETKAAQELGSMIWAFLSTAGSLVQEIDTEDELKLLRLRTKKQELVIVPETKYILVLIHDTPPA
ncbi:rRNA processing protein [Pestalotiopsis sp. IQ-011]